MKCFEWLNKQVGDYDIFLVADKKETEKIVQWFSTEEALGCKSFISDEWYYFLNTQNKTITPMPNLSLAFGGQYNDDLPYGEEILQFGFDIENYSFKKFTMKI